MSEFKDTGPLTEDPADMVVEGQPQPYPAKTAESQQDIYDGTVGDNDDDPEEKARVEAYQSKPFFRRYFLEWILFFYTIGINLYPTPLGALISEKLCIYNYHYDEVLCKNIQNATESIKNPILDDSTFYGFVNDAVINVPGALAALISGNYLTRYGFRAPMLVTLTGGIASCLCQLATVIIMPAPVYMNTLAELPGAITGGAVLMLTATYSYVALQVPHSLQLKRIMMVTIFSGIGLLIGVLPGGVLAMAIGMEWLMICCVVVLLLPTALVFFSFEDIDVPQENKNDSWRDALWLSAKSGFSTAVGIITEKRPQRKRAQIIALLMCFFCAFFGLSAGNGSFAFTYARAVLNFDQAIFGIWNGIGFGLVFVFLYPCLVVIGKLKLSHPVVIAVGSFFFVLKFGMLTLAEFFHFLFYIQLVVGIPYFVAMISIRAYITDLLEVSEVPVVMALLAAIEKVVPVISGVVSTAVFHFTNLTFPGCVYLIMTVNYIISIVLALYCKVILNWNKRDKQRSQA